MRLFTTPRQRVVLFHGLRLIIPTWARFVAVDEDGAVYAFEHRPVADDYEWRRVTGTYTAVCDVELEPGEDWRNLLLEYKDLTV
ncbi:hypothetical protein DIENCEPHELON_47 [Klebsiella phage vB_KaeS_Diencephalon]|nr:hypothetical protein DIENCEPHELON_47 [Klebsiella phage vB_KaeS_Diencephalon]UVX30871.1 hypothetical protein S8a_00052 [Klebsiella phage VLCpiS8a]